MLQKIISSNPVVRVMGGGLALALLFWLALSAVYAIPGSLVKSHLSESAAILESEGDYPYDLASATGYDNYTATIMLVNCAITNDNPFVESLRNSQFFPSDQPRVTALEEVLNGEVNATYSRYWHGYILLLKPLCILFNVQEIRIVLQTIFLVMCGITAAIMSKRIKHGLSLGIMLLLSCGFFTAMKASSDLPLFFSFFIMLLGVCAVALVESERLLQRTPYVFFIIGALTVYFDFLDTPIITLGVPLCVYLMRLLTEDFETKRIVGSVCVSALLWAFGYGYLWILKWLLAAMVLGPDVISGALNAASFRLGVSESAAQYDTSSQGAIELNLERLGFVKYIMIAALVAGIALLFILVIKRFLLNEEMFPGNFCAAISALLVVVLPYAWYAIFSNHSCIHTFVYRDQLVTLFALLSMGWFFAYLLIAAKRNGIMEGQKR